MIARTKLITLVAVMALAVSMAGCIDGGSTYAGDEGDGVNQDITDSDDGNPFDVPGDEDGDDDDGDAVDELPPPQDKDKTTQAAPPDALGFIADGEELSSNHAKAGEDYVSELIEVTGGSGEGFEWTHDLPAGFDLVPYNDSASRVQIENVEDVTEAMVGEHAVTLVATDVGTGEGADFSFVLTIDTAKVYVHFDEDYVNPCSLPLTIEVETLSGISYALWDGETAEEDPSAPDEVSVVLGTRDYEIRYRAMRGDTPARDVEWSYESELKDSLHCLHASYYSHSAMGAYDLVTDLMRNEYMYHYRIENGRCENGNYDEEFEGVPGVIEPMPTVNESWHVKEGETGSFFTLVGDFVYKGPLPVRKFRKSDGRDDLNRRPVEQITVRATDSCMKAASAQGSGMRVFVPFKKINFNIDYPDESVEDVKVRWKYRDKSIPGCAGGRLGLHLQHSLNRLSDDQLEDMAPKDADDWHKEHSLASRQYDLLDMAGCKDETCKTEWKKFVLNDDENGGQTVGEVLDLVLYLNLGGWVEACSLTDCTTTYPDLDIREIEMESGYWYAEFDDDDNIFDNNVIKKSGNGVFRDYKLTAYSSYPGMTKSSVKCSGGQCHRASIFRRKAFPNYD